MKRKSNLDHSCKIKARKRSKTAKCANNWRCCKKECPSSGSRDRGIESLLDLSAKVVAANLPFQTIEERINPIPEHIQERIVFYSFPQNETDIYIYSSFVGNLQYKLDYRDKIPYYQGIKLLEKALVRHPLQIGFHLSGTVSEPCQHSITSKHSTSCYGYKVSISFDRCKITSVQCACGNKDLFWCQHIVALTLFRIRRPCEVDLRVAISESLLKMSRDQLQKFAQYLIAYHPNEVLPTAQKVADEILNRNSSLNQIRGAPDPTAGGAVEDDVSWHLDEEHIREQVRYCMHHVASEEARNQLTSMYDKVRQMLRVRDSNGPRLLTLITDQLMTDPRARANRSGRSSVVMNFLRQLWEDLASLWICVLLNPTIGHEAKRRWKTYLGGLSRRPKCPLEDGDMTEDEEEEEQRNSAQGSSASRRSIFDLILDTARLSWDDIRLQVILSTWDQAEEWDESFDAACFRVHALRFNGFSEQALRLAVAIIRHQLMSRPSGSSTPSTAASSPMVSTDEDSNCGPTTTAGGLITFGSGHLDAGLAARIPYNAQGWVGMAGNPLGCLVDCLLEASLQSRPGSPLTSISSESRCYTHLNIPCCREPPPAQSYLCLALLIALKGLCQQRNMPRGQQRQEKALAQESKLLNRLGELPWDEPMRNTAVRLLRSLLDGGWESGLARVVHTESFPLHASALFLFNKLRQTDENLAYEISTRAMRLPVLSLGGSSPPELDEPASVSSLVESRYPRWPVMRTVEANQSALAVAMITTAKDSIRRLDSVLKVCDRHIHTYALYSLSEEVFEKANRHSYLLCAAFHLALNVAVRTVCRINWRRRDIVRWLVTCALEVGPSAVAHLVQRWPSYLTPSEAANEVAPALVGSSAVLHFTPATQEQINADICRMALQAARKDPVNCCLAALTLTAKDHASFEAGYKLICEITESNNSLLSACQIFTLAHFMDHRGCPQQAFRLAVNGVRALVVPSHQDTHPAVQDVFWCCHLAHSLGKTALQEMISAVIKSVHCPTVLADIMNRCTLVPPGSTSKRLHVNRPPLRALLDATVQAFITATRSRLAHISPRHYTEFLEFLMKAHGIFSLVEPDGEAQFRNLLESLMTMYKGKKKLIALLRERFCL